ncbi:hypothetical protein N7455_008775 [Penicillium solitum]|uniref:uncharacterized protein n=1 Tax=Penicillium solitum TaxID=60172 RepID=UPI0032C4842D|nr:hypothetical protein N7455_008775 [Penicillium solitum]
MGSTRRGDTDTSRLNNTYPSARPTLSSPLDSTRPTPAPVPVSAMSHPTRHFLEDTRNNPGNYCVATPVSNLCPTLLPHNPGQVTVRPYDYASLHPRQTQLCTYPTTPPGFPMHNIFQMDTTESPPR